VTYEWDTPLLSAGVYTMDVEMLNPALRTISTSGGASGYMLAAGPVIAWTIDSRPWTNLYYGRRSGDTAEGTVIDREGNQGS